MVPYHVCSSVEMLFVKELLHPHLRRTLLGITYERGVIKSFQKMGVSEKKVYQVEGVF